MLGMEIPLRRIQTMKNPTAKLKGGWCLDLFIAMVQHSVAANVGWSFSGKELKITATKDIKAGKEIFFFG
jgi:hypothetical protein